MPNRDPNLYGNIGTSLPKLNNSLTKRKDGLVWYDGELPREESRDGGNIKNLNWVAPVSQAIGSIAPMFSTKNETVSSTSLGIRNGLTSAAISSGVPIVQAIGAGLAAVDAFGDATGLHNDDFDKDAAKRAGYDPTFANLTNAIPGFSTLTSIFSPEKTKQVAKLNPFGENAIAGYSGIKGDLDAASKLENKRSLFGIGVGKMNNFIDDTSNLIKEVNKIGYPSTLLKRSDYARDIAQNVTNTLNGTNRRVSTVGKNGMRILSKKELEQILAQKFQNGGVIGTDTSIIPEGALHARLNHLDEVNSELEDVTRKGIPVLDENGSQVAEIEQSELILRLEITKKIEELMKDGSEEAMIEAGKILVYEIIDNTQDNTGILTEEVDNG